MANHKTVEKAGRAFVAAVALSLAAALQASAGLGDNYMLEAGVEVDSVTYEEPGYMKESGLLYGIRGTAIFNVDDIQLLFHASWVMGQLTYDGAYMDGTPVSLDTPNDIYNLRFESSWDFGIDSWKSTRLATFYGIAYRLLVDDLPGDGGYRREQSYWYAPVGLELEYVFETGSVLGTRIEYDWFISGHNESGGSIFDQDSGYGIRPAMYVTPMLETEWTYNIEVFYQYWNIDKSTVSDDGYVEPENTSKMFGIATSAVF